MLSIAEKLWTDKIDLDDVIESGDIPDHILHNFACDCAEKALLREEQSGRKTDPRSWEAIRVKRLWIEGNATNQKLDTAWAAARAAAWVVACDAGWNAARQRR